MRIKGVHHIAVAVDDIEKYSKIFKNLFDLDAGDIEINKANNVGLSFVDLNNCEVEFLKPLDNESAIAKFLAKRGPGIHHFCIQVEDIHEALDELKKKNIELIDQTPRQGAGGSLIAFIHPRSAGGILIELKQEKEE
ncbi:MAG: methylmalonyl-CoA epimerase [Candidatus Zixiibacteriota bacterium]|nr:MAG: methylmalonyl-CoA epimerase [candidate division Zixibacteria bacterium]